MTSAEQTTKTRTLTRFLIEEQRRANAASDGQAKGSFIALVNDVRLACKRIATLIAKGKLANALGEAGSTNVQGEAQMKLDVLANDIFVRTNEWGGQLAGMLSEEREAPYVRSLRNIRAESICSCSIRWTDHPTSTSTSLSAAFFRCSALSGWYQ